MPRKRERRARQGWSDDPLVPIDVSVLQALLEERGWGPSELARQTGTKQQNISAVLQSGEQRRCRRSLRTRIAQVLHAPEELLAGEPVFVPSGPHIFPGFEYRYSARTELAASRLLTRVKQAVERDCATAGPTSQWLVPKVIEQVAELVRIREWRQKLIVWPEGVEAQRGYSEPATLDLSKGKAVQRDVPAGMESQFPSGVQLWGWESQARPAEDPAHEAAILGLMTAIEHVLTPWFNGQAQLNYHSLKLLSVHIQHAEHQTPTALWARTDPRAAAEPVIPNTSGSA